jgi:tetratricopeptide (TPR) repeat protein
MQTSAAERNLSAERKCASPFAFCLRIRRCSINLPFLLYDQAKYAESIRDSQSIAVIDAENYGTKMYLGMNYLRTEKYEKAERHFSRNSRRNPR